VRGARLATGLGCAVAGIAHCAGPPPERSPRCRRPARPPSTSSSPSPPPRCVVAPRLDPGSALLTALAAVSGPGAEVVTALAAALTPALVRRVVAAALGMAVATGRQSPASRPRTRSPRRPHRSSSSTGPPASRRRSRGQPGGRARQRPDAGPRAHRCVRARQRARRRSRHRGHAWTPDRPASPPRRASVLPDVGLLTAAPGPQQAVADAVVVRRGDSLWTIAGRALGPGASDAEIALAWPSWYAANRDVIGPDPALLRPGQLLRPAHLLSARALRSPASTRRTPEETSCPRPCAACPFPVAEPPYDDDPGGSQVSGGLSAHAGSDDAGHAGARLRPAFGRAGTSPAPARAGAHTAPRPARQRRGQEHRPAARVR
jgi:nucleoid-associated protein YgaU